MVRIPASGAQNNDAYDMQSQGSYMVKVGTESKQKPFD